MRISYWESSGVRKLIREALERSYLTSLPANYGIQVLNFDIRAVKIRVYDQDVASDEGEQVIELPTAVFNSVVELSLRSLIPVMVAAGYQENDSEEIGDAINFLTLFTKEEAAANPLPVLRYTDPALVSSSSSSASH